MGIQLIINKKCYRERFNMERFIGSDDIFALVESGRFAFESPDGRFEAKENEGVLFRKGILYHRRIIEPATLHLFRYRSDTPLFKIDHIIFSDTTRIKSTIVMLGKLESVPLNDEFEYRKHLFLDIVNQYAIENERFINGTPDSDTLIEQAIVAIKKQVNGKIFLSEIGEKTGLSYVQFLRRFQAYTGLSPSDYIISLRLQRAKNLLIDTDMLIKDIADLCGFENEYYFSNFFKKKMGMSPSAFRNL